MYSIEIYSLLFSHLIIMIQAYSLPLKKRKVKATICEEQPNLDQFLPHFKTLHHVVANTTKQSLSHFSVLSANMYQENVISTSVNTGCKRKRDIPHCKDNKVQNSFIERPVDLMPPTIITSHQKSTFALEDDKKEHISPSWLIRFKQLQEFKDKYGHCHVPQRFLPNKSLGKWVHKHRQMARENVKSIKIARYRALEKIGFWSDPPDRIGILWNRRYAELIKYRNQFGNCNVPQRYAPNLPLGIWVHRQRGQIKKLLQGKQTTMTLKRAQALFEIGFHQHLI